MNVSSEKDEEAPHTPKTSETKSVRSEMSSRRLREMERRQKSSTSREPLRLSGRKSSLFCTPPSLLSNEPETAEKRSERVRREASERMKREKLRLSNAMTQNEITNSSDRVVIDENKQKSSGTLNNKPPSAVRAARPPACGKDRKSSVASTRSEISLASNFEAVCFITENEHEDEQETSDRAGSIGAAWPPPVATSISPQIPPFPGAWGRALVDLECSPTETEANSARDSLLEKIVWVSLGSEEMISTNNSNNVAARVKAVVKQNDGTWQLGLELMCQAGRTIFVSPDAVTLLSMRELMELPPPPPPQLDQVYHPPVATNDENAPPQNVTTNTSQSNNDDETPPALRPSNRIPEWANTHSDLFSEALERQRDLIPPTDFICRCNGATRTCDLAKVFKRPSLARHGYRETGDWSKDDW